MRPPWTAALVLAVIGLPSGVTPADAHSTRTGCRPKGRVVLANRQVEVYAAREPAIRSGVIVSACAFANGRVTRLGNVLECSSGACVGIEHVTLDGQFVAYSSVQRGEESARNYVLVREARSGRVTRKLPTGEPLRARPEYIGVGQVESLVVTSKGIPVWIANDELRTPPPAENEASGPSFADVYVGEAAGPRLLAAGADVEAPSLALAGNTVYWTQAGKPASARI